jgi:hypothetical protein
MDELQARCALRADGATASEVAPPLSKLLWGLDWDEHLPWELSGGITVTTATLEETLAFAGDHYAQIFGTATDGRFLPDPMTPAKRRFLALSDRFMFRDDGNPIGLMMGQPADWSTYYWRTIAFLPAYQGRGLFNEALPRAHAVMRDVGIERAEGDVAPINQRQVRALTRLGLCVTGSLQSERWGTMLRMTKHLSQRGEEVFATRFCRDASLGARRAL